jgi:hypothetical protein
MMYVRIRSYYNGTFTSCEHLYFGNNQSEALNKFREKYPEHEKCVLIAEAYDSNDERNREHFKACLNCGCVHN